MLIGHKKQWEMLKKNWLSDSLSHAYLLSGGDSLGKKKFTLEFVKLINCEKKNSCGKCHACKMISKLNFPDLLFVKSSSSIKIIQVRKIQEFLSYRPYTSNFKIVIVDEAERMNQNAQSCLLKTLEEPKGNTILFLISSRPEMLLPTVSSRCESMKFFYVKKKMIFDYFLEKGVEKDSAEKIADISFGKPGKALDFFQNPERMEEEKEMLEKTLEVLDSDFSSRFNYAKDLDSKNDLTGFFEILQNYLRSVLLKKMGIVVNTGFSVSSGKIEGYSDNKLKETIEEVESTKFLISSTNTNPKLALELLFMKI